MKDKDDLQARLDKAREIVEHGDVSTPPDRAVFWSGTEVRNNRLSAQLNAHFDQASQPNQSDALRLLADTPAGRDLSALVPFEDRERLGISRDQYADLWNGLSERYASEAAGNARTFVEGAEPDRTFRGVEQDKVLYESDLSSLNNNRDTADVAAAASHAAKIQEAEIQAHRAQAIQELVEQHRFHAFHQANVEQAEQSLETARATVENAGWMDRMRGRVSEYQTELDQRQANLADAQQRLDELVDSQTRAQIEQGQYPPELAHYQQNEPHNSEQVARDTAFQEIVDSERAHRAEIAQQFEQARPPETPSPAVIPSNETPAVFRQYQSFQMPAPDQMNEKYQEQQQIHEASYQSQDGYAHDNSSSYSVDSVGVESNTTQDGQAQELSDGFNAHAADRGYDGGYER